MSYNSSYVNGTISDLHLDNFNARIIALVISKREPRAVNLKRGETKYVLNFTLRDSETDSVNVSLWADQNYVMGVWSEFNIGDVVEIRNPLVQVRPNENTRFNPSVSSTYQLSLSETRGEVKLRCDLNLQYQRLLRCAPPAISSCFSVADVIYGGDSVSGNQVSLLAAIKSVGDINDLTTKDGRQLQKIELRVFDQSYPSFLVTLWGNDLCKFAKSFVEAKCVVLLCDIKIQYNNHLKSMSGSSTSATVIVLEPDCKEGGELARFASTANLDNEGGDSFETERLKNLPVVTVSQTLTSLKNDEDFSGVIFGTLTKYDLDGPLAGVVMEQCAICRQILKRDANECTNEQCKSRENGSSIQKVYSINVSISDHTGTIENCMLKSEAALEMIGLEPKEFIELPVTEKTKLKWNFLLERCKITLSVDSSGKARRYFRVLSCIKADLYEYFSQV